VVRRRIRADPHVDASAQIITEVLHDLTVANERRRAVRDRGAVIGNELEITLRPPTHPGMAVEEYGMPEDRGWPEQAGIGRPLDGGLAVASDHLQDLGYALRGASR